MDQLFADEQVTSTGSAGNILWALGDNLNSIRDIADLSGSTTTITNHRRLSAYGKIVSETNSAVDLEIGFTGKYFDEVTGLQFNVNRWYDPFLGQWLSEDPIGFKAGDPNQRRYVGNSTNSLTDSTGLDYDLGASDDYGAGDYVYHVGGSFFWSIGENLYNGVGGLVSGETGSAIGNKAVELWQDQTGDDFVGTSDQWGGVLWNIVGETSGAHAIAESYEGTELITGNKLTVEDRIQRGAAGVGAYAGWWAGGIRVGQIGSGWGNAIVGNTRPVVLPRPNAGAPVYRIGGGGSMTWGRSWTTVDPRAIPNFRAGAGLPLENAGDTLIIERLTDPKGIIFRPAIPLQATPPGPVLMVPELLIPDPTAQLKIISTQPINLGQGWSP